MPHDFPPWEAVYQQARRWLAAGWFEAMAHDLRAVLRLAAGAPGPSAVLDGGPDPEWSAFDMQQADQLLIYGLAAPDDFGLFTGSAPVREVDWPG